MGTTLGHKSRIYYAGYGYSKRRCETVTSWFLKKFLPRHNIGVTVIHRGLVADHSWGFCDFVGTSYNPRDFEIEIQSNLRPDDYREVKEGHGHEPLLYIPHSAFYGETVYFTHPDGRIAGVAGVQDYGQVWMLTTPAIHDYPITFAREAKRWIDSRPEERLWNIVYAGNTVHIKLLQFLGFKLGGEFPYGPNNLHFIEFQKCAPPQQLV